MQIQVFHDRKLWSHPPKHANVCQRTFPGIEFRLQRLKRNNTPLTSLKNKYSAPKQTDQPVTKNTLITLKLVHCGLQVRLGDKTKIRAFLDNDTIRTFEFIIAFVG